MEVIGEDEVSNWPMGQVDLLQESSRLRCEPLIYDKPKPIGLGNIPQPHVELKARVEAAAKPAEKVDDKPAPPKHTRETIIAQQKRIVKLRDISLLKSEVATVIREEQNMQREGNARSRMCSMIMVQCLKLVDLFEEGCEMHDALDDIEIKTQLKQIDLDERIAYRNELENENQGLRNEVSTLQKNLHNTRQSTNQKVDKQSKLHQEITAEKAKTTAMMKAADGAKVKMSVLRNAMAEAEKSMESSIKDVKIEDLDNL